MEKPSRVNERLTLIANVAVVLGIIFLALEMRQNTEMMRAQIRDSITAKQMEFYGWVATSPELAEAVTKTYGMGLEGLSPVQAEMVFGYINAIFREWEKSFYQYDHGLFTAAEFEARRQLWRDAFTGPLSTHWMEMWEPRRAYFAPDFRAAIDGSIAGNP